MTKMISHQDFSQRPLPMLQISIAHQAVLFPLYFFVPFWIVLINILSLIIVYFAGENLTKSKVLKWLKVSVAFIALLVVYMTFKSLSGKQAGVALISVMYGLKVLETRNIRDANLLLSLGFFILVSGFLLTQKPWILFYQLIPIAAILNALIVINSLNRNNKDRLSVKKVFKDFAKYLLFALPIMILLFIFFPRLDGPIWRMPGSGSGMSGVSDTMTPGEISSLQLSQKIAFRVKFEGASPDPSSMYWRVLSMDRFDGLTWSRSRFLPLALASKTESSEATRYVLTLEPTKQNYLVTLDRPDVIPKQGQLFEDYSVITKNKILDRTRYSATSLPSKRFQKELSNLERRRYLSLPNRGNPRARQWAKNYRQLVDSDRGFIQYILKEINQKEYFYTLNPPIMNRDLQDSFWFQHKKGFCEHYSSALVFLARAANIPARIVVGYQGGEKNPLSDYWIVRDANAHAWTEVWINGEGWIRVDPTSAIAPHRVEKDLHSDYAFRDSLFDDFDFVTLDNQGWFKQFDYWVDGFNNRWNDWILDYNREQQLKNFNAWGLGWIKPVTIIVIVFIFILLSITLMSIPWKFNRQKQEPLAKAFLSLQQRLYKRGFIELDNAQGAWELKRQLSQHGVIQFQNINQLIDEYIKLRYQKENPEKIKVKNLIKRMNRLVIPKHFTSVRDKLKP